MPNPVHTTAAPAAEEAPRSAVISTVSLTIRLSPFQVDLKEAYGNAAAASFALDPPVQGPVSSFQEDRAGAPAIDMDPADRGPSTLALSVEPRQVHQHWHPVDAPPCVFCMCILRPARKDSKRHRL